MEIIIGTYSKRESEGIYKCDITKDGKLSNLKIFCKIKDSKYICVFENLIFSIFSKNEKSGVIVLNKKGEVLSEILYEEKASCFITVIDNHIYTANYHTGEITKISYQNEKKLELKIVKTIKIKEKAGAHMVYECDNFLLVPCLLLDKIYVFDKELNEKNQVIFNKNQGVRHLCLSGDNQYVFALCENSCELIVLCVKEDFKKVKTLSLTDNLINKPKAAAIRMNNKKDMLFISIREVNTIVSILIEKDDIKIMQEYKLSQKHPRDILNILDDKILLVSGMDSDDLVSYKIEDKIIKDKISEIKVFEGVSINII